MNFNFKLFVIRFLGIIIILLLSLPFLYILIPVIILGIFFEQKKQIPLPNNRVISNFLLFLFLVIFCLWIISWFYFIPNPSEVWSTLFSFDFKLLIHLYTSPFLEYERYFENLLILMGLLAFMMGGLIVWVLLGIFYDKYFSKFVYRKLIHYLKQKGYQIFETKYTLKLSDSNLSLDKISCECCQNNCENIPYVGKSFTVKEIEEVRNIQKKIKNNCYLPSVQFEDNSNNKCHFKWEIKLTSCEES
jgi:hypothetical protein